MMAFGYIEQDVNIFWQQWNFDPTEADAYRSRELAQKIKEIKEINQFVESRATELGQTNKENLVNNLNVTLYRPDMQNGKHQ